MERGAVFRVPITVIVPIRYNISLQVLKGKQILIYLTAHITHRKDEESEKSTATCHVFIKPLYIFEDGQKDFLQAHVSKFYANSFPWGCY